MKINKTKKCKNWKKKRNKTVKKMKVNYLVIKNLYDK